MDKGNHTLDPSAQPPDLPTLAAVQLRKMGLRAPKLKLTKANDAGQASCGSPAGGAIFGVAIEEQSMVLSQDSGLLVPSQTTTPPTLKGQQSVPVSGEGAQTASPSQDRSATAKPVRSPRSPSRERGPRSKERTSASKERHGSCATPAPKGQEQEVSGASLPGSSAASSAGAKRERTTSQGRRRERIFANFKRSAVAECLGIAIASLPPAERHPEPSASASSLPVTEVSSEDDLTAIERKIAMMQRKAPAKYSEPNEPDDPEKQLGLTEGEELDGYRLLGVSCIQALGVPPLKSLQTRTPRWKLEKADWATFKKESELHSDTLASLDVEEACEVLTNVIVQAAQRSIPKTSGRLPSKPKPWWNEECSLARKRQNCAWTIVRGYPNVENVINFKKLRAKARKVRRQSKKTTWMSY
ncbi:hypothetical protein HPB47_021621, partial [Ixodes persulcatus]